MNGLSSGIEMRWVLGNYSPAYGGDITRDQAGIWVRRDAFTDPDDPNPMGPKPSPAELKGKRTAYTGAKTAITAALKPSGMDAAIGKPLMPAMEIVDAKLATADAATVVPALWDAVVKAGPALGMKEKQPFMKVGPFTALKVDGDHATVKSGPRTMKIDKIGGKWLIDAPLPEPASGQ